MKGIIQHYIILIIFSILLLNCKSPKDNADQNTAESEKWIQLFNGVDLEGWNVKISGHPYKTNWKNTFIVRDSAICVDYKEYKDFDNSFGHLFYEKPFSNYKLKMKYRFVGNQAKGGENWAHRNSGVMIHCQDPQSMKIDQAFPVSLEVQLLGGLEEGSPRSTANLCSPGTHVHMNDELVTVHCIDSGSDTFYGDQWIDLEVEVRGDSVIKHSINGAQVLEYNKPVIGGEYNTLEEKAGEPLKDGYISLQSESHPVEFKNIMLLELN
ncbi:3-keto-disaccharide hydrolase [Lutimonas zeaxanthinifaciens]|uniref:3-keto-disaccharide hydrolase n=1 Tax=Lutimonas zeaxanthinifaciens TaxID=3060215 RepID=UPI00265CC018|nr:DUF1080 domain-containing protein [Lutimonas sp. YSD2104]WKK66971.1 DUF1080 domain-containing protein [Lutimonas sp. YSD2104]